MKKMKFGLIGKDISYSFSQGYFKQKFLDLGLDDHSYENFDLRYIDQFPDLLKAQAGLKGLNVTIPYKQEIITYLDELDPEAKKIGAVNTIKIDGKRLIGYNTDAYGFQKSLESQLRPSHHDSALILGTGGASKAIAFVLGRLGIDHAFVSRNPAKNQLGYHDIDDSVLGNHSILINCTPLGTYPNINEKPDIPYQHINTRHLLFDLIYNPKKTAFLKEGEQRGAGITNGLHMLELQADKSWEIWNG